jgi:hypothetical protein
MDGGNSPSPSGTCQPRASVGERSAEPSSGGTAMETSRGFEGARCAVASDAGARGGSGATQQVAVEADAAGCSVALAIPGQQQASPDFSRPKQSPQGPAAIQAAKIAAASTIASSFRLIPSPSRGEV